MKKKNIFCLSSCLLIGYLTAGSLVMTSIMVSSADAGSWGDFFDEQTASAQLQAIPQGNSIGFSALNTSGGGACISAVETSYTRPTAFNASAELVHHGAAVRTANAWDVVFALSNDDVPASGSTTGRHLYSSSSETMMCIDGNVGSNIVNSIENSWDAQFAHAIENQHLVNIPQALTPVVPFTVRAVSQLEPKPFVFHEGLQPYKSAIKLFLSLLPRDKTVIFFDTETTGISNWDRIIEIAFVKRNYATMMETRWYALLNPDGRKSQEKAYECHHIHDSHLVGQPTFLMQLDSMLQFIGNHLLVAHNVPFDRRMLEGEFSKKGIPFITNPFECTLKISRELRKADGCTERGGNKLDDVCDRLGIDKSSRNDCHGAMQDTLLLADTYPYLKIQEHKNHQPDIL